MAIFDKEKIKNWMLDLGYEILEEQKNDAANFILITKKTLLSIY
ncbi:MAG: hypothetical protein ACM3JQ_01780 [Candidatus Eiseniibacteriota bacterium]